MKAIRELNDSPHAAKALELSSQQELSKQIELRLQSEKERLRTEEFKKQAQMEMAEQRKQHGLERNEEERRTALYKAKVQSKLEEQQLQERRQYDEELLKKQHEEFLRQEALRKKTEDVRDCFQQHNERLYPIFNFVFIGYCQAALAGSTTAGCD